MKTRWTSELFSVFAIGAFFGVFSHQLHEKWHGLGREAFLSHESQIFDKSYASPPSIQHLILVWIGLALPIYFLFKLVAIAVDKFQLAMKDKDEAAHN